MQDHPNRGHFHGTHVSVARLGRQNQLAVLESALDCRRNTVGVTPFDYLTDWRIGVAQDLMKRGHPLKIVAPSVGYASSMALTRVFSQRVGLTPTVWVSKVLNDRKIAS